MALSGTINGSTANEYIDAKIEWSATQSVSGNYSTVTATLKYSRNNTGYTTGGSWEGSITINGTKTTGSKSFNITYQSNTVAMTATVQVPHNSDGTKSITISAAGVMSGTTLKSTTVSGTVTLNTIPRASEITSAAAVTLGNKCNIKWVPKASSFVYKVKLSCGSITHTSDFISPGSTSTYTYAATMSESYWAGALSTYSATCKATLYTYQSTSGSAIGSDSATFKLTLSSDETPTISFATPTLVDGWNGYYLQNKSKCKLSATFAPSAGSSIKSCSISGTGISLTGTGTSLSGTTSVLTKSGSITYTAKVTDGRATVSDTQTITVYAYAAPTLSLSATRVPSSTNIKVTYKAACSSVNSENTLKTLTIYTKLATASTWKTAQSISLSSSSVSSSVTLTGFELTASHDFKATVTDAVGTSTEKEAGASTDFRLFNMQKSEDGTQGGIALGKLSEDYTFDCDLEANFGKTLHAKNKITTESIFGSTADYNTNNFAVACQWADGDNHDLIVRNSDGKTIGLGWKGNATYPTTLEIRPSTVNCSGTFSAPYGRFTSITDAAHNSQNTVPLRIGNPNGEHVDFDTNEMQAKSNATTASQFTINYGGGDVYIGSTTYGGNLIARNTVQASRGRFTSTTQVKENQQTDVALRIGTDTGIHIDFDTNEIQAKASPTTTNTLYLNFRGGDVMCGNFRIPEIQTGTVTITPSAANTPTSKSVTFPKEFSGAPKVVVTPRTGVPGTQLLGTGILDPTTTGVTICLTRTGTTSTSVDWIAIY